jgi:cellulose synthase/poly-beta-1,6-N-acetylglucosamine synthase-like glycosyltransferase
MSDQPPTSIPIDEPAAGVGQWSSQARTVITRRQKRAAAGIGVLILLAAVVELRWTAVLLMLLLILIYLATSVYRLYLAWTGLRTGAGIQIAPEQLRELDEATLPRYTILVPLYRETSVLQGLTRSLGDLDYPKDKLEIFLLLEEDDTETIAAARERNLPHPFEILVVPQGVPKSKPRACNVGLSRATSEYTVIFDAEDQPERDQLKKVVYVFRTLGPKIGCVQGKLNYYNQRQNLLTRWFAAEYSMWFDFYLPGLDATGAPIPLGGTSNHFPTKVVRDLGGWDAFNVAEDADLGIRMARAGYSTAVVDSTTWEEATSRVGNWIRQRSRWIKGYAQTWLVNMRHPVALYRDLGPGRFWSFQATVGGTVLVLMMNPLFWLLAVLWYVSTWGGIEAIFPGALFFVASFSFFVGNFAFAYAAMLACLHRRYFSLAKYALLVPFYWVLMSIAAWKGLLQLITKPFYWEKTVHGHFETAPAPGHEEAVANV